MTPEEESLQLIDPAYDAILLLASARFPGRQARPQKDRLLTRLLREGLLSSYWHASEYARIVELLARKALAVVEQLGTSTIPHMKVRAHRYCIYKHRLDTYASLGTDVHVGSHSDRPVLRFLPKMHPGDLSDARRHHAQLLVEDVPSNALRGGVENNQYLLVEPKRGTTQDTGECGG